MADATLDVGRMIEHLVKSWRMLALNVALAGGLVYGITFLMPVWYRATAVILPPEETEQVDTGLPVQRFLSRMPSLASFASHYTAADIFKAILDSRTVQQAVLERFGMQEAYRTKTLEQTLKEFRSHAKIALAPNGTIAVSVEDRSAERAARLANALIEELDRFNVERRNSQARRTRQFLERRVAEVDSLSRHAEAALRSYQEKHHIVTPVEPGATDPRPVADLLAKKFSLEVELSVLKSYVRGETDRVLQVRTELDKVNAQLSRLPALETELGRLIRDARLYQQAYTMLSVQLEDSRIRETMDTPTVTVLDPAVTPGRRSRPVRSLWVAAAMALAGLASALWLERRRGVRQVAQQRGAA